MKLKHLAVTLLAFLFTLSACKKVKFDTTVNGEALQAFKLLTLNNNTVLPLNSSTPDKMITFTWTAATPGVKTLPTYKLVAAFKTGSLDKPVITLTSDNAGKDTKLTLTYLQLDQALQGIGIAAGAQTDLIWSVVADNGYLKIRPENKYNISVTRFGNGCSPFILLGPLPSLTPLNTNPNSTTDFITFNWTRSKPAVGSPAVTYKVLFAERKLDAGGNEIAVDWSAPLFTIVSGSAGVDSFVAVSYKRMSDSLTAHGFNASLPANIKWTVIATSGTWNQKSDYENYLVIVREIKVYVVGSATPGGWDISQSTRLIEDPAYPGTYFTYINLSGGNEIKFVNGQNWPPFPGAIDWGQENGGPAGNLAETGENNISIPTTGVYRVTMDLAHNKFYVQTETSGGIGAIGMIGGFQSPQWSYPTSRMTYLGVNKFINLVNMTSNDEFKFHDGAAWDNSANNKSRWYGMSGTNVFGIDIGGGYSNNKWTGATGLVRAYWDGSDTKNLTYSLTQGTVYLVGADAALGSWNNSSGASLPQMTYLGNGQWTINVTVSGPSQFKFVVQKGDWNYLYGDGGGGNAQWRNGASSPDPNACNIGSGGSHTITLNEYTRTFTIL